MVDDTGMSFGAMPIEFVLLRNSLAGDLTLTPGTNVTGRVLELLGNGRAVVNMGGVKMEAQLPANVGIGDILRLQVTEAADDRLTLKIVDQQQPQAATTTAAQNQAATAVAAGLVPLPLPGGAQATLLTNADGNGEGGRAARDGGPRTMVLRYDSELLGRVDVVVRLDEAQVSAVVLASPGHPLTAAREGADVLRGKLRDAAERPAQVLISARQQALDVTA